METQRETEYFRLLNTFSIMSIIWYSNVFKKYSAHFRFLYYAEMKLLEHNLCSEITYYFLPLLLLHCYLESCSYNNLISTAFVRSKLCINT